MRARRVLALLAAVVLVLTGCSSEPPGPTFEESCAERGGAVLSDTTTKLMTGTVTGVIVGSNGSVGTGTGVATSAVSFTVTLCTVEGHVVDMEVS